MHEAKVGWMNHRHRGVSFCVAVGAALRSMTLGAAVTIELRKTTMALFPVAVVVDRFE